MRFILLDKLPSLHYCIFTTHFHEMRGSLDELAKHGGAGALRLCTREGKQTYRIAPGFIEEKAFAYEIAKKYGLEYRETEGNPGEK